MFSKLALFVAASMAVFVAALPADGINGACSTGPVQCCNSGQSASSTTDSKLNAISAVIPANVQAALDCTPILNLLQAQSCNGQTVCCSKNTFNGVVDVACTPVNLNL